MIIIQAGDSEIFRMSDSSVWVIWAALWRRTSWRRATSLPSTTSIPRPSRMSSRPVLRELRTSRRCQRTPRWSSRCCPWTSTCWTAIPARTVSSGMCIVFSFYNCGKWQCRKSFLLMFGCFFSVRWRRERFSLTAAQSILRWRRLSRRRRRRTELGSSMAQFQEVYTIVIFLLFNCKI